MDNTRPLKPNAGGRRYELHVLSGPHRGELRVPDANGRLRVIRLTPAEIAARPRDTGWLALDDPAVSRVHFEIEVRADALVLRDTSTNGTLLGGVRLRHQQVELAEGVVLRVGETDLRLVVLPQGPAREAPVPRVTFGKLLGESAVMQKVFARAGKFARSELPVFITGETGTGKSVLARTIHEHSRRKGKTFKVLDCASVSLSLLESELFGHCKGAFTSATRDRPGIFESAKGGTVFIDEIGDLPLEAQAKLLRVLEEKVVRRVGDNDDRAVDVRVIAATHRDLASMVSEDRFRLDLYERFVVAAVEMPPLRARREDLDALADSLVTRIREVGEVDVPADLRLPDSVRADMRRREWPGNVRELYNYLRSFLATGESPPGRVAQPPRAGAIETRDLLDVPYKDAHDELLVRFDKVFLTHQLHQAGGEVQKAAQRGGLHRATFSRRMQECGLVWDVNGDAKDR